MKIENNIKIPFVSIACHTYNHAPYIRQCVESFLMQETTFHIEILINDDASTDGTADIIREYEYKYPYIIKPIYQVENQYSKEDVSISDFIFPRAQGRYIAMCEGDDYWTDPLKLQKQVDFMEANEDFSICFHPVTEFIQRKNQFINITTPDIPSVTDIKFLADGNYIYSPSVLYRKNLQVLEDFKKMPKLPVADYYLHMLHAKHGKIKKLSDTMAVYRVHDNGTWSLKPKEFTYPSWLKLLELLLLYFKDDKEVFIILVEQFKKIAITLINLYISKEDSNSFETFAEWLCERLEMLHEACNHNWFDDIPKLLRSSQISLFLLNTFDYACCRPIFLNKIKIYSKNICSSISNISYNLDRLETTYATLKPMLCFAERAKDENKNIIIWGAGQGGVKTCELLEHYGFEIHAFLDSSPDKVNTSVKRLPIYSPEILNKEPLWNNSKCCVFIASYSYSEIALLLETVGFSEENSYFVVPQKLLSFDFFPCLSV